MTDYIVGMMWNRNEGDILEETITDALKHVDSLFIADDASTDNSWKIIESFKTNPKVEHIQRNPNPQDQGQKQAMLGLIRERYKPENTWVQVIESDVMICDTDVRDAIEKYNIGDVAVCWHLINAVSSDWETSDTYPLWKQSIKQVMPLGHRIESLLYTYRPLPGLVFDGGVWRPWPNGFHKYTSRPVFTESKKRGSPLLGHYGYRGPTHFLQKYNPQGLSITHKKYVTWDLSSRETIKKTVPYFNGLYSSQSHEMTRYGWKKSRSSKQWERLERNGT